MDLFGASNLQFSSFFNHNISPQYKWLKFSIKLYYKAQYTSTQQQKLNRVSNKNNGSFVESCRISLRIWN